jgi:hypothetical protein
MGPMPTSACEFSSFSRVTAGIITKHEIIKVKIHSNSYGHRNEVDNIKIAVKTDFL